MWGGVLLNPGKSGGGLTSIWRLDSELDSELDSDPLARSGKQLAEPFAEAGGTVRGKLADLPDGRTNLQMVGPTSGK